MKRHRILLLRWKVIITFDQKLDPLRTGPWVWWADWLTGHPTHDVRSAIEDEKCRAWWNGCMWSRRRRMGFWWLCDSLWTDNKSNTFRPLCYSSYIFSLALADLLVIIICVPLAIIIYTTESSPMGGQLCRLTEYAKDVSVGVSVFTLTALSAERYCAIVNPLRKLHVSQTVAVTAWPFANLTAIQYTSFDFSLSIVPDEAADRVHGRHDMAACHRVRVARGHSVGWAVDHGGQQQDDCRVQSLRPGKRSLHTSFPEVSNSEGDGEGGNRDVERHKWRETSIIWIVGVLLRGVTITHLVGGGQEGGRGWKRQRTWESRRDIRWEKEGWGTEVWRTDVLTHHPTVFPFLSLSRAKAKIVLLALQEGE